MAYTYDLPQNVQYLILALFWLTSKPVARKFLVLAVATNQSLLTVFESSVPLSLHHLLPFPRTHIHPHDFDATNSPTWTARYGRRGPNSPPSLEEAPSLGQRYVLRCA